MRCGTILASGNFLSFPSRYYDFLKTFIILFLFYNLIYAWGIYLIQQNNLEVEVLSRF